LTQLWLATPPTTFSDPRYRWVYSPYARVVHSTEGWSVRHTNSMGLLDDELRVPRARVRAVLLGDSFTEALQVAQDADFESIAERRMPGLELVSVGCSGRSPVEYADWLDEYGPGVAPDIVIVQLNDWDLADVVSVASLARQAVVARGVAEPMVVADRVGLLKRLWRKVERNSALASLGRQRIRLISDGARAQVAKRLHGADVKAVGLAPPTCAADPRLPALMDALHRRIAAHAPRLIYLYIPSVDYFGPRFGYGEPQVAAFYHDFATRNRVTLVDPLEQFRAEFVRTGQPLHGFPNSVMGSGHLNAAGHRVLGERLARAIAEAMR
jgi:lysophospholipase L1-like esterase